MPLRRRVFATRRRRPNFETDGVHNFTQRFPPPLLVSAPAQASHLCFCAASAALELQHIPAAGHEVLFKEPQSVGVGWLFMASNRDVSVTAAREPIVAPGSFGASAWIKVAVLWRTACLRTFAQCMSTLPYTSMALFSDQQQLSVSTQPSPIEQPLSPPVNEGEQSRSNGRMTKHCSRSCVACQTRHQGCDNNRPCQRCKENGEAVC